MCLYEDTGGHEYSCFFVLFCFFVKHSALNFLQVEKNCYLWNTRTILQNLPPLTVLLHCPLWPLESMWDNRKGILLCGSGFCLLLRFICIADSIADVPLFHFSGLKHGMDAKSPNVQTLIFKLLIQNQPIAIAVLKA